MLSSKWLNTSIRPIDGILAGTITQGQSGSESNRNDEVPHITLSSRTGPSPSDGLVSYLVHSLIEGGVLTHLQRGSRRILQSQSRKAMIYVCLFSL